ncbi:MAG: oligosaccharide flippase family protein [Verrucomicrobiales bacterium]|nr:oligosaccharide flippase family protein [Verrucomicrobiales bacterium]
MDAIASNPDAAKQRNQSIQWAVLTSILSKAGTFLLRIVSIPIAIKVLGTEAFGVYATITAFVALIDLIHYGMGPVLTEGISRAVAARDRESEVKIFGTSVLLRSAITLGFACLFALLIGLVPPAVLFGAEFAEFAETVRRGAFIALIIITLDFILVTFEHARNGYQEARISNAWGAGGNFVAAGLLVFCISRFPSVETLILAIHGPVVLARLGNAISLVAGRRYLASAMLAFSRDKIRFVLGGSVGYTLVYVVWCTVEYIFPVLLLGRFIGPGEAGVFEIFVLLHVSLNGLVHMVNYPLLPAFFDASERGDRKWIIKAIRRLYLGVLVLGGMSILGFGILGEWALGVWIGDKVEADRPALLLFGFWFALHAWRQVHQVILLGLGKIRRCAWTAVVEGSLIAGLLSLFVSKQLIPGIQGVFAAICIGLALVTAWYFPLSLKRHRSREH